MRFLSTTRTARPLALAGLLALGLVLAPAGDPARAETTGDTQPVAALSASGLQLSFAPRVTDGLRLTVAGPGVHETREFPPGAPPSFVLVGKNGPLPDGLYKYELRTQPQVDQQIRAIATENDDDALIRALAREEEERSIVQAGRFEVRAGSIVLPRVDVETNAPADAREHGPNTHVDEH